jgi:hypothetical protein
MYAEIPLLFLKEILRIYKFTSLVNFNSEEVLTEDNIPDL